MFRRAVLGALLPMLLAMLIAPGVFAQAPTVHISFLAHVHPMTEAFQAIIDAFEEDYPHISVEMVVVPATGNTYQEQILAMLATGTAPDVIYLAREPAWESGALMDLTRLAESDPEVPAIESSLIPGSWKASMHGPRLLRVPIAIVPQGMYINTDHFAEAGLAVPGDTWHWNEFLDAAIALTRRNADGEMTRAGLDAFGVSRPVEAQAWVYQTGGRFFDDEYEPTRSMFTAEPVLEGLRFIHDLRWRHNVQQRPGELGGGRTGFAAGNVSMRVDFPAGVNNYAQVESMPNWRLVRMPFLRERAISIGFNGVYIAGHTKNLEAAWEFAKYFAKPKAQAIYAPFGQAPVSMEVLRSREWLDFPTPGINKEAFFLDAAHGHSREMRGSYGDAINRIFAEQWERAYVANEISVEQAATEMQRLTTEFLADQQ